VISGSFIYLHLEAFYFYAFQEGGLVLGAADHSVVLLALSRSEARGTGGFGDEGSFSVTNTNPSPLSAKKRHILMSLNCNNTRKYTLLIPNDGQGHTFQRRHVSYLLKLALQNSSLSI